MSNQYPPNLRRALDEALKAEQEAMRKILDLRAQFGLTPCEDVRVTAENRLIAAAFEWFAGLSEEVRAHLRLNDGRLSELYFATATALGETVPPDA